MGTASYSQNPNDEIMPLPWTGYTGFRGAAAVEPPWAWVGTHRIAEVGGFFRERRNWRSPDRTVTAVPVKAMPTAQLYQPLVERISLAAAADIGYTVDQ